MNKKKVIVFVLILLLALAAVFVFNRNYEKKNKNIPVERKYYILESDGDQGIIDKKGNVIIKPQYVNIVVPDFSKPVFFVYNDKSELFVINDKSEDLYPNYERKEPVLGANYDPENQYRPVIKFTQNDKVGLLDLNGRVMLKPIYDDISSLNNDIYTYKFRKDGKIGLANSSGKIIINPDYSDIVAASGDIIHDTDQYFENHGFKLRKITNSGQLEGYADENGKIILQPKYQEIKLLRYDKDTSVLKVKENGKFGYHLSKKQILPSIYQELSLAKDSLVFKKDSKYGLMDKDGKELLAPRFDSYKIINEYIEFTSGSDETVFNSKGEKIDTGIDRIVDSVPGTSYLILETYSGERFAKDLKNPDKVIKDGYLELSHTFGDNFIFFKNEKYGLASLSKGELLKPIYDYINVVPDTKIYEVKEGENYSLYDSQMNRLDGADKYYLQIKNITHNETAVILSTDNDKVYYDKDGNVSKPETLFDKKAYPFKENNKWGFKTKKGDVFLKPKYDMVGDFNNLGFAGIKKDGKWGVINIKGEVILKPKIDIGDRIIPEFVNKYLIDDEKSIYAVELKNFKLGLDDKTKNDDIKSQENKQKESDLSKSSENIGVITEKQEAEYEKAQKQKVKNNKK